MKLLFIIAAIKLHDVVLKPIPPTALFIIPIAIFSLIATSDYLGTILAIAIYTAIIYGYFWLISRFDDGLEYWGIMVSGAVAIVLFL